MCHFKFFIIALSLCLYALISYAEDSWGTLQKAANAGRNMPLSGDYVHQTGGSFQGTFQLFRSAEHGRVMERRAAKDGLPREIIRKGYEVISYAPDQLSLKSTQLLANRLFPAILPEDVKQLKKSYTLQQLGIARVADVECQWYQLKPQDSLRYEYKLCLDRQSALPLKMIVLVPEINQVVEQISFTSLIKKAPINSVLSSQPTYLLSHKQVEPTLFTKSTVKLPSSTLIKGVPYGFRLVKMVSRVAVPDKTKIKHYMFSDGLANFSIFIQPKTASMQENKPRYICCSLAMASIIKGDEYWTIVGDIRLSGLEKVLNSIKFIRND